MKSITVIAHQFNQANIAQTQSDSTVAGKCIPKGYVNATQLCKANKKLLSGWNRTKESKLYVEALSLDMQICTSSLIVELEGTPDGDASLQGTWVHPQIAIEIARWISPTFAVWANKTLMLVINGDFKALTAEAEKAQAKLTEIWNDLRLAGKITRRTLTDAVKAYLETHSTSENYRQWIYSNCSDKINLALFDKKASQLKKERGCKDNDALRDTHSKAELVLIDRIEGHAVILIDKGMEPLMATQDAIAFYG